MMSLYDLIENLLALCEEIADSGAMLDHEIDELEKLEAIWYNYYEKGLRDIKNELSKM